MEENQVRNLRKEKVGVDRVTQKKDQKGVRKTKKGSGPILFGTVIAFG